MIVSSFRRDPFQRLVRYLAITLVAALSIAGGSSAALADATTDRDIDAAVAAAKTPADHQALAALFTAKADAALAVARRYEARRYAFSGKSQQNLFLHYQSVAASYRKQAHRYAALADQQTKLAEGK